jgi:hypothetical protein
MTQVLAPSGFTAGVGEENQVWPYISVGELDKRGVEAYRDFRDSANPTPVFEHDITA